MIEPDLRHAPEWFLRAIATPRHTRDIEVEGARIQITEWDAPGTGSDKPALLLLHGYRAHSHIWDCIAPYFSDRYRVVAPDFSGMGESGWRENYTPEIFCEEIRAVIDHLQLTPVTAVGHSYGGGRLVRACAEWPELFRHAILLDIGVHFGDDPPRGDTRRFGNPNPRPDYASQRARFRLLPSQPAEEYLVEYTAFHSIRRTEAGWGWKFDTALPTGYPEPDGEALLRRIPLPVDVVYGQHSIIMDAARARRVMAALPGGRRLVEFPEGHHHFMLENPLALVALLRGLLE